jgi:4-amino-4-deoxy-L-arabinose transferase-like glycosyltransferase
VRQRRRLSLKIVLHPIALLRRASPELLTSVLFVAWILPGLFGHDPWKPDEGYGFGLVNHIVQGGSWVVPTLAGEPFMEKPPLYYLTAAALATAFSPPLALHDAARLATVLYMGLTAFFIWLSARALFGRAQAHFAVIVLLGCVGLLVHAHQLITDIALLSGFAIGLYGLIHAAQRPTVGGAWLGAGAGIGFMAKGLLAPGVLALSALALPLTSKTWRTRRHLVFIAAAALSICPWLLWWPLMLHQLSPPLFSEWMWDNNFGRFFGLNNLGPRADTLDHLRTIPWFTFPALPLAVWALWSGYRRGYTPGQVCLLVFFCVTLGVLSISHDARELYALPLLLPLALLAVPGIERLPAAVGSGWYRINVVGFTVLVATIWATWIALEFGVPATVQQKLLSFNPGYIPAFSWIAFLTAVVYTALWAGTIRWLAAGRARSIIIWTMGLCVTWALAMTLLLGWVDAGKTYRSVVASLRAALPGHYDCIAGLNIGESERAMLEYFGGIRTVTQKNGSRAVCTLLLVQTRSPAERSAPENHNPLWEGGRPGNARERFLLYRRTP